MTFTDSDVAETLNADGQGAVVLLCEHASNFIPEKYGDLGLSQEERDSHIAWDPGARAVALALSRELDGPLVAGRISRLVYDCNRPPTDPSAMAARSENTEVPGNADLTEVERRERVETVYHPFCEAVTRLLNARAARGLKSILVTIHSFTPVYRGQPRAVEIGVLHDDDSQLADAMLDHVGALPHRVIYRNAPYGPQDGVTHSLRIHAQTRGLLNVMLEIRNDLIQSSNTQSQLADEVLALLQPALSTLADGACDHA